MEDIPEQVSAVVSQIASEVSADKPDGNVLMHMDKSADSDNEKNTQNDAVQVEQGSTTVGDEQKQQTEEKQVEIQPDEGMDRTGAEPDRIHSKETELGGLTIGQKILRPAEEQSLVHQHQVEKEIADSITVDQPHSVNTDESEGDNLVDAEQYVSGNAAVSQGISTTDDSVASADDMETEMAHESVPEVPTQSDSQEPAVTPETNKPSVEETSHPSFGSPEETSSFVPHPTSPSFQPPAQAPTMPITQPPSASPPHLQSQQIPQPPSPPASSLPDNLQVEVEPPEDTPNIEPSPRDASPREHTPQEDVPPQVTSPTVAPTSPDPLAEAKAKARSVVEMRERRLNEESQSGTRDDDSGYDVDHYEQEVTPPTESRQVVKQEYYPLLVFFTNLLFLILVMLLGKKEEKEEEEKEEK